MDDYVNALSLVSTQELLDELVRRNSASDSHGMIAIMSSPTEGSLTAIKGHLTVSATNPLVLRQLLLTLLKSFRVCAGPKGIHVPNMEIKEGHIQILDENDSKLPSNNDVCSTSLRAWLSNLPGVFELPVSFDTAQDAWETEYACLLRPEAFASFAEIAGFEIQVCAEENVVMAFFHQKTGLWLYLVEVEDEPVRRIVPVVR